MKLDFNFMRMRMKMDFKFMRMRIIWGAKVPQSGVMRTRMTLSGYGINMKILFLLSLMTMSQQNFLKAERLQLSVLHHKKVNTDYIKSLSTLNLCKHYLLEHKLLQDIIKSPNFGLNKFHLNLKNQAADDSIDKCTAYIDQHEAEEKIKQNDRLKEEYEEKMKQIYRMHLVNRSKSSFTRDFLTMRY